MNGLHNNIDEFFLWDGDGPFRTRALLIRVQSLELLPCAITGGNDTVRGGIPWTSSDSA